MWSRILPTIRRTVPSLREPTTNFSILYIWVGRGGALSHRAVCVAGPLSVNIPVSCFVTFKLINCALSGVARAVKCASWFKESKNQDIVNWSLHRGGSRNASKSQCLSACHLVVVERRYPSTHAGKVLLLTPQMECLIKQLSHVLCLAMFLKITN